jgi:hypothetical protein
MNFARAACLVAAGFLCAATATAADVPLQVTIRESSIGVINATPGGNVVLFAAGLDGSFGILRQRRLAESVTADATGAVEFVSAPALPYRTICVAVDVETGRMAIGGPADYEIQLRPFPVETLKRETDGISGLAGADVPRAELLVVRPKGGAWRLAAAEGGSGDDDRQHDGKLTLDFSTATAIGAATPAPKRLKNKDVVVLIDSARLEVFTTEISQ